MSAISGDPVAPPAMWSVPWVLAVMALPIGWAMVASAIQMREPGGWLWWFVAGACFLLAPGIAAWAGLNSAAPTAAIRAVALVLFAVLFAIGIANLPDRSHPGVYLGGGTVVTPLVIAAGIALGWDIGSAQALRRLRAGSAVVGFVIGGAVFAIVSVIAFYAGVIV
jgi:hypothetical protein